MKQQPELSALPERLLPWYEGHKRDLPWRQSREPYRIWVSEIMLQQTRVQAVLGYYARFLEALPDVKALSEAPDELLRKLWEGLGYYSRVRNLKKAAQTIEKDYGGQFPRTYPEVLGLSGIGEYTAGAICSIAFDLPTPAVDGNVLRVCARLLEEEREIDLPALKKELREALADIYPQGHCGAFTQALMELGATVCVPNGEPHCTECPMKDLCRANLHKTTGEYPKKLPKKGRKTEELTVFILHCHGKVAICKRPETGLLAGLWEFPHVPGTLDEQPALEAAEALGIHPEALLRRVDRTHIFTHILWKMRGYELRCSEENPAFLWKSPQEIQQTYALPTAFRQFWDFVEP